MNHSIMHLLKSSLAFVVLLLIVGNVHGQSAATKLQLLNAALHDTTFLKKAPPIQYPIVLIHKQERFYQADPETAVEYFQEETATQPYALVEIMDMEWTEAKGRAAIKMLWNSKIVKLRLQNYQLAAEGATLRAMKVRGKGKVWPTYLYFTSDTQVDL